MFKRHDLEVIGLVAALFVLQFILRVTGVL